MVTCESCFEAIPDADVSLIDVSKWPASALRELGFDRAAVSESFGPCAVLLCRLCRDRGRALELAHAIATADYRCTPDFFGRFLRALHAGHLELADGWHRMALVGWTRTATLIRDAAPMTDPGHCPECSTSPHKLLLIAQPSGPLPRWCPICGCLWTGRQWLQPRWHRLRVQNLDMKDADR